MVTFNPLPSQEWDIANLNEHIFTKITFSKQK